MLQKFITNVARRHLFAVLLLALGPIVANAQEVTGVEIFEHGLYEVGASLGEFAPPNLGYRHEIIADFRHLETAEKVLGRVGVSFGVRYRILGNGVGAVVPIRVIVRFPPQGIYNPQYRQPLLVDETVSMARIGDDGYSGITFDEQWEIEPGFWTIEFWHGDQKLGEQKFEVITPPIS